MTYARVMTADKHVITFKLTTLGLTEDNLQRAFEVRCDCYCCDHTRSVVINAARCMLAIEAVNLLRI